MSFGPHKAPPQSKRLPKSIAQSSVPSIAIKQRLPSVPRPAIEGTKNHSTASLDAWIPLYQDLHRLSVLRTDSKESTRKFEGERSELEGVLGDLEIEFGKKRRRRRIELELDLLDELNESKGRDVGRERIEETLGRLAELLKRIDLALGGEVSDGTSVRTIRESSAMSQSSSSSFGRADELQIDLSHTTTFLSRVDLSNSPIVGLSFLRCVR